MEKNEFFIKENTIVDLEVEGLVFKFRKVIANDELDWYNEYTDKIVEKDKEGKEKIVHKENIAKLVKCKMRNIVEVPFSKEELKEICGIDKEFKDYSIEDKDKLFGHLNPPIMNKLVALIDATKTNQKKS